MTQVRNEPSQQVGPQSVLQRDEWGQFQSNLGRTVRYFDDDGWSALAVEERTRAGRCWYLPYGPVADDAERLRTALQVLRREAADAGIGWLRCEPILDAVHGPAAAGAGQATNVLRHAGAVFAPRDIQPRRSRWVDIAHDPESILSGMTGTNRNLWRRYEDKDLVITASWDPAEIDILNDLLQASSAHSLFRAHDPSYLREAARTLLPSGSATLYVTRHQGEPVCAMMVYDSATTRVFAHSAMKEGQRKLRPNQPMIVQAMLDAAAQGKQLADLFGIAPTDDDAHPWAGFSQFKRSFGGYDVNLSGTWDLPVRPVTYQLYLRMRQARDAASALRARVRRPASLASVR